MSPRGSNTRIYVGNLPEDVDQTEIESLFEKFGRIRDIDIKYARSMLGTTYAFLEFDHPRDAEDAIERRNGYKFGGTRLRVEFTGDRRPKRIMNKSHGPPKRTSHRVFVTGLPIESSWQDLKDHMRKVGPVGYANIENRIGIVEYENKEDVERAIKKLDRSQFQNIFHKCEIRVKLDKHSSIHRERSHSRTYRQRRSKSRSRSFDRSHRDNRPSNSKSYSRSNSNKRSCTSRQAESRDGKSRKLADHRQPSSYSHSSHPSLNSRNAPSPKNGPSVTKLVTQRPSMHSDGSQRNHKRHDSSNSNSKKATSIHKTSNNLVYKNNSGDSHESRSTYSYNRININDTTLLKRSNSLSWQASEKREIYSEEIQFQNNHISTNNRAEGSRYPRLIEDDASRSQSLAKPN